MYRLFQLPPQAGDRQRPLLPPKTSRHPILRKPALPKRRTVYAALGGRFQLLTSGIFSKHRNYIIQCLQSIVYFLHGGKNRKTETDGRTQQPLLNPHGFQGCRGLGLTGRAGASRGNINQTRRRFGGRHPLWGSGVTSMISVTWIPAPSIVRIADSRPLPGPLT